MYQYEPRRGKATKEDLIAGKKTEESVYKMYKRMLDPQRYDVLWLNKTSETLGLYDLAIYDKVDDFVQLYEIEGKNKELLDKVVVGLNSSGKKGFEDLHISNKNFFEYNSGSHIKNIEKLIGRELTKEEFDQATFIMVYKNAPITFCLKINIKESIVNFYLYKLFNKRHTNKTTMRDGYEKKEKFIAVPFSEVEFHDYNNR